MNNRDMFLHDQAIGAVMMALQKCLSEQSDITDILRAMKFRLSDEGLMVLNPPVTKLRFNLEQADEVEDASV